MTDWPSTLFDGAAWGVFGTVGPFAAAAWLIRRQARADREAMLRERFVTTAIALSAQIIDALNDLRQASDRAAEPAELLRDFQNVAGRLTIARVATVYLPNEMSQVLVASIELLESAQQWVELQPGEALTFVKQSGQGAENCLHILLDSLQGFAYASLRQDGKVFKKP